jgi:hypothetical protein
MDIVKKIIQKRGVNTHEYVIPDKVKPEFFVSLLDRVFTIYLKPNSLRNNAYDVDIHEIKNKIIHIDNEEIFILLSQYKISKLPKDLLINWVAYDYNSEEKNAQEMTEHLQLNKHLILATNLDFFKQKNTSTSRTTFRLDLLKMEKMFANLNTSAKKYLAKTHQSFYSNLFDVKTNKLDINVSPIIGQEFKSYTATKSQDNFLEFYLPTAA